MVLLYGTPFWKEVLNFEALVRHGMISERDLNLFQYADDVDTAFRLLTEWLTEHYLHKPGELPEIAHTRE
jgi:hypothetical protein